VSSAQQYSQALGTSASAMGFVNQAVCENDFLFAGLLFVGRCHRGVVSVLPNPVTGGEVLRGAERLSKWPRGVFFLERFLFVLPGESSFSSGNLLSAGALAKSHASTMTYSGQEEERAPSIYRAGPCSPEALARVRRSKVF
jgi:hypothetical protein